jgi:hypothetical protein
MKRFDCSGSSGLGLGRRAILPHFPVNCSIGEPLSDNTLDDLVGTRRIVNAKRNPLVVAEIELGEIAVQVLLADMVIGADDAAPQDREIALDRIGVPEEGPHVFLGRLVDGSVTGKLFLP